MILLAPAKARCSPKSSLWECGCFVDNLRKDCYNYYKKPLAAGGAILGDVWTDGKMPVADSQGDEFLKYVKTGMKVTVSEEGEVTVE